jgi:predicted kinase
MKVRRCLSEGCNVVVDNTNVTLAERAALLELGRSLGVKSVIYYFESRLADCIARNAARTGKARIPDVGLYTAQGSQSSRCRRARTRSVIESCEQVKGPAVNMAIRKSRPLHKPASGLGVDLMFITGSVS